MSIHAHNISGQKARGLNTYTNNILRYSKLILQLLQAYGTVVLVTVEANTVYGFNKVYGR